MYVDKIIIDLIPLCDGGGMEAKKGNAPPIERAGNDGKRTAILVIHGVGEQNPFDTLDGFVCGLYKCLQIQDGQSTVSHRVTKRDAVGGGNWTESFIQFDAYTPDHAYHMDVHECYWADLTEKKISVEEVFSWMGGTLLGAVRFYKIILANLKGRMAKPGAQPKKLQVAASQIWLAVNLLIFGYGLILFLLLLFAVFNPFDLFGSDSSLKGLIAGYWVQGSAGLAALYGLTRFKTLVSFLKKKLGIVLIDYIGDVAIYTTTDEKSRHFQLRQQILARTQTLFENILNDPRYDRVIVAGHSLGSVIAYDVLNRINIKENVGQMPPLPVKKIAGLVTFGSPLDKVALFFGQHAGRHQHVRRQIMEQLYSFRAVPLDPTPNVFRVGNPIEQKLDGFPWVNYWSSLDPISGYLDFYMPLDNVHLDVKGWWGTAHVKYWETDAMYADMLKRYFPGRAAIAP